MVRWWERLPGPLGPGGGPGGGPDAAAPPRTVSRWLAIVFAGASVALLPWIAVLYATLPSRVEAANWRFIWVGFDLMLVLTMGGTAVQVLRGSPRTMLVATAAGTLLIGDAWFDVLTSDTSAERWVAVLLAVVLELPLAGFCYWVASTAESLLAQAVPHLAAAGFTVRGRTLVPPDRPIRPATAAGPDRVDGRTNAG